MQNVPHRLRRLHRDQHGSTTLEWLLLLGAIALPSYAVILLCLDALIGYYQMLCAVTGLPFP